VIPSRTGTILEIEKSEQYGGRYNTPGQFGALYLSRTIKGCEKEVDRRPGRPDRYDVGKIKVTLEKVCDLTDPELLKKLKIAKDQLITDDYIETRLLGELAREEGFEAIIVPSAAGNFNNLVIFKDKLIGKSRVELEEITTLVLS
jgi:RES domain-containing protein